MKTLSNTLEGYSKEELLKKLETLENDYRKNGCGTSKRAARILRDFINQKFNKDES